MDGEEECLETDFGESCVVVIPFSCLAWFQARSHPLRKKTLFLS